MHKFVNIFFESVLKKHGIKFAAFLAAALFGLGSYDVTMTPELMPLATQNASIAFYALFSTFAFCGLTIVIVGNRRHEARENARLRSNKG